MLEFIFGFFAGAILAAAALIYVFKDEIKATAIRAWDKRMAGISSAGDDGKPDR
jgi:energy-converting hydrogenase Eha subunit G